MNIETWKQEFYPVEAEDCLNDDMAMINHAILKFSGLSTENLRRYGLTKEFGSSGVIDSDSKMFYVDADSCALCLRYVKNSGTCLACPLYKERGMSCDGAPDMVLLSPYTAFTIKNNPEPMLKLLKSSLKNCEIKALK